MIDNQHVTRVDPLARPVDMRRDRITIRKVPATAALQWRWQLPIWTGSYFEGWSFSQRRALQDALAFLGGLPAGLVQP